MPPVCGRFQPAVKYTTWNTAGFQGNGGLVFRATKATECFQAALALHPSTEDADTLRNMSALVQKDFQMQSSLDTPIESVYKVRGITFTFLLKPGSPRDDCVLHIEGMRMPFPMRSNLGLRG